MAKASAGKLAGDVDNITTTDTIAAMWKELLYMAYSKWADDDSTTVLSALDSTRLWTVGALCPYTEGPAVYLARTMLFSLDSAYMTLENSCEFPTYNDPSGKRENPDGNEEVDDVEELLVQVYPNPTTGVLNVGFVGEMEGSYRLRLVGINGTLVREETLTEKTTIIDITDLSKGIYFVEVASSTKEDYWRGKVVLIE